MINGLNCLKCKLINSGKSSIQVQAAVSKADSALGWMIPIF